MKRIFVFGWYNQGNIGDEAFKSAFIGLWGSKCEFVFDHEIPYDINEYDAMFVGGGSFLDQKISGLIDVRIPIGFIGVGIGRDIHPDNLPALESAKIVIARNKTDNQNFLEAPDLLFSRIIAIPQVEKNERKILIIGNDFLTPKRNSPVWKASAHSWFAHEFSKICDRLIDNGRELEFVGMGFGHYDDRYFNASMMAEIENRDSVHFNWEELNEQDLIRKIAESEVTISLRLHGMIFATLLEKKFVGIRSHDKMKSFQDVLGTENFLDYYGISLSSFNDSTRSLGSLEEKLAAYSRKGREQWVYLSGLVAQKFDL